MAKLISKFKNEKVEINTHCIFDGLKFILANKIQIIFINLIYDQKII